MNHELYALLGSRSADGAAPLVLVGALLLMFPLSVVSRPPSKPLSCPIGLSRSSIRVTSGCWFDDDAEVVEDEERTMAERIWLRG